VGAAVVGAGTSVGAETAAVGATSVGVAAGLQAESANENTAINVSKKNVRRLFIFFSFI
jgi:hypothetical protein